MAVARLSCPVNFLSACILVEKKIDLSHKPRFIALA
jgi:hypothetical protein